jgi:hypothetical protein
MSNAKEVANLCKSGVKGYNEMNGRIYETSGAGPTLRANSGGHNEIKILEPNFRVRKLTPKENWRLMGLMMLISTVPSMGGRFQLSLRSGLMTEV